MVTIIYSSFDHMPRKFTLHWPYY